MELRLENKILRIHSFALRALKRLLFVYKMLRPFVRRWRSMGISGTKSLITVKVASAIQRADLSNSGLKANESKLHWEPMQVGEWLGFIINTIQMTFQVPQRKLDKLRNQMNGLILSTAIEVKDLARVAGQILSMTLGLGPIARLFTRQMYFRIAHNSHWHQCIDIDTALADELKFWLTHVSAFNGCNISRNLAAVTTVVYSDASLTGYGGYTANVGNCYRSSGMWSPSESQQSSTWREMKAIVYILTSFQQLLKNHIVIWYTDSANVARIVQYGSSKQHLHQLAIQIFKLCLVSHVELQVQWLPRTANQNADYLSRIVDPDDWAFGRKYFQTLNATCGPFSIDRFAADYNCHLARFNSRFWSPRTEAVDAFSQDWSSDNNWLCCRFFLSRIQFISYVIVMHGAPLLFLNGHLLLFGL